MEAELSISQVAKQTGQSIDTLRYYERIGLIEPLSDMLQHKWEGHKILERHLVSLVLDATTVTARSSGMREARSCLDAERGEDP